MAKQSPIDMMNEDETKNWIKVGLSFYETKETLVPVVGSNWSSKRPNHKPASEKDIYHLLKFITDEKALYEDENLQEAAKTVLHDRNEYVHDLPEPKVTDVKLKKWKEDMLTLLRILDIQKLTENNRQTEERIEEICGAMYTIVREDVNNAMLSCLEAQVCKQELKLEEHTAEIKSIKDSLRNSDSSVEDLPVGETIKQKIDKVVTDMMQIANEQGEQLSMLKTTVNKVVADMEQITSEHGGRLSNLENTVDEVKDKVNYLINKDPDTQEKQRAINYVEELTGAESWNSKSRFAISKLKAAFQEGNLSVVRLLTDNGVRLSMEDFPDVMLSDNISKEILNYLIKHLQDNNQWNADSLHASTALDNVTFVRQNNDLINILKSEGIAYGAGESEEESA